MSRASASIMSDLLIGRTITEILPVQEHFEAAIGSRGRIPGDQELIGDGIALMGAAKFPARIKCVLMPWKAYQAALVEAQDRKSTRLNSSHVASSYAVFCL